MSYSNESKIVLITGCSSGIGRALVHEFRKQGCRVFASARDISKIRDLGEDILTLDMLDPSSYKRAVDTVVQRAGRIDILVNNAGVGNYVPAVEVKQEELHHLYETNFFSVVGLTQYTCTKYMIPARSGTIVMISSMAGEICTPFNATYASSKAALTSFSNGLRMELKPFGVGVVLVKPGGVQSDIVKNAKGSLLGMIENSLYSPIREYAEKRANESQDNPMPADQFSKIIVPQILGKSNCIIAGTKSTLLWIASHFPYWLTDLILSKRYGLSYLRNLVSKTK
eukprot:TRINITY_DN1152_c0_g1_i1.p1 TRINITY_DN1152_c0_g1~~TRINITY_DN1152_c0_g1_i1.p1  ORF type:complete len:283 (-),score=35.73 TRINITY_DN1152_c0_g1_i1:186-1034(-)